MKIKSIKLENHKILGNLFLDFTDENGDIVDTVILAGENGTGKSVILNLIYEFSGFTLKNETSNEKREFVIQLSNEDIDIVRNEVDCKSFFKSGLLNNEVNVLFDYSKHPRFGQVICFFINPSNIKKDSLGHNFINDAAIPIIIIKSIFADAEINFTPRNINSVTETYIDQKLDNNIKSLPDLGTIITKLLIDIQILDDLGIAKWVRNNPGKSPEVDKLNLRMKKFEEAFNYMFPNKKYKEVIFDDNNKKVIFEECGKEMSIEKLSSGEKQIVFRGSFLLKDQKSNEGALVLIDEPEISMHPKWQLKIVDFYKKLFTDENGNQTSQLFIATHSPFIIHNDTRKKDKVIILAKDINGNITIPDNTEYFGWTDEQIVKKAFDIDWNFTEKSPIVFVEGETDEAYLKKAKEVLNKQDLDIEIKWIGRINKRSGPEFTGDTALNQTKSFLLANPNFIITKIILLYDSDTNKPCETHNKLFIRCMPTINEHNLYKKGIENLLVLPDGFPKDNFYKEQVKTDDYGGETTIRKLDKTKLCKWICNDIKEDQQKKYFEKFEEIFTIIGDIIK